MAQAHTVIPVPVGAGPRIKEDAPRHEFRKRVKIRFRDGCLPGAQTVIAGHRVAMTNADPDGWVELVVYESDVERIEACVEDDPGAIERAQVAYMRNLKKWIRERTEIPLDAIPDTLEEIARHPEMHRAEQTFTGSVEREFYTMLGRGLKPFAEVKVLKGKLDPPMSHQEQTVAQIVKSIGGGGAQPFNANEFADALVGALARAGVIQTAPVKPDADDGDKGRS